MLLTRFENIPHSFNLFFKIIFDLSEQYFSEKK